MRWLVSILFAGLLVAVVGCLSMRREPGVEVRGATPLDETDHLEQAANKLKRGDDSGAIKHLQAHVKASPDAVMVRAYLAELYLQSGDGRNAQKQFARFLLDADRIGGEAAKQHRVHAHTRLMELAQEQNDSLAEARHRGVGLVLLAEPWNRNSSEWETTMCQAVVALREATEQPSYDPVSGYYLALAQVRMGQPTAAEAGARRVLRMLPHPAISADMVLQLEEWCSGQGTSLK